MGVERTVEDEERSLRVLARLAPKVRGHKHLETLLTTAPPQLRQVIYNTLKPELKFIPKPLDVYVATAGQMAEREQLPTMDAEGKLHEFKPASDASSLVIDAENAIASALAKRTLTLVCSKCTHEEKFHAVGEETNVDVILKARRIGWIYDYTVRPAVEICPACPTSLRENG